MLFFYATIYCVTKKSNTTTIKLERRDNMETFGARITRLRKENNLTQQELADKLNISRQALSAWERDKTEPDLTSLKLLADEFNVDLNTLLGNIEKKETISTKQLTILYIMILAVTLIYISYLIFTKTKVKAIISIIPFILIATTIYFAYSYSIKTKDFSMLSGYNSSLKYNKIETAKMLNAMGNMILIDTLGYIVINIILDFLPPINYSRIILFFSYIVSFFGAIIISNQQYKNKIVDINELNKYKSLNKLTYTFLGFIIMLIVTIIISNLYFKIPNNTPKSIAQIFIILPIVFINVIVLIIEQDYGKNLIEKGQQYQFTRKVYVIAVIDLLAIIAIVLLAIN